MGLSFIERKLVASIYINVIMPLHFCGEGYSSQISTVKWLFSDDFFNYSLSSM
ncbi:hypothetical protein SAMN04488589_1918 [Methanolobus vulcani]|jgi:hypothetical protein|uniref:Uncharacterized protein n=1 Tax=Methanolobus vulcani TaxID=38026 RepID=A0A7Z7B0G6_9EURY|nr:hypothetical protein [Methanolobus vulcani]MDK2826234.1 hypothetical protein [Methanolobus sp.]MDK2947716.1 hypothetical protein [Methanolobus sp.]SDG01400.1 hypothetical protein SAMN04488589_1918 [Methanolobus vulcani]